MIRYGTLPNGMKVITEQIPHAISASAGIWITRGSRFEPPEKNGITHFVEHMFFKGTEKRSALEISRQIESIGGTLNAFTGKEFVCIHSRVLDKYLGTALELISDIFLNAVFLPEEIERERGVIVQEIKMVEDTPEDLVHELFAEAFWRGNPLGLPTLGTYETVGSMDRTSLLGYAETLRDPGLAILSVAGNVHHDDVLEMAFELFGRMEHRDDAPGRSTDPPTPHRGLFLHRKDLEQSHMCMGTMGFHYAHPMRYAFHVLNTLLGGGMSSRLFQEIREKRGLAYSVYSFQSSYFDTGMLGIYVGTTQEQVRTVVELLIENLSRIKCDSLTETEITTAKEQLKGNLLLSTESTSSRMSKLAMNEIYFGRQLDIHDVIKEIEAVDEDQLHEISRQLFRPEFLSLMVLGDVDGEALSDIRMEP